jgi:protein-S-isoprenylcysteine O-methyltransferase Ste14
MILYLVVIPVLYFTDYRWMENELEYTIKILAVLVCGLGLAIRIYTVGTAAEATSGRNREEQVADSLNTTGIYSMVRHPLYLGNYLMWAGIVIYTLNLSFFIIISLAYWIYYERIMFAEERFLERKFGEDFNQWAARTPAFIPAFRKFVPSRYPFRWPKVVNEYSGLIAAVVSFVFIELLQNYFTYGEWAIHPLFLIILGVTVLLVILIKFVIKPRLAGRG